MGITCRACGRVNADGAQFCANPDCGAYLGWEASAPRQPAPAAPPAGGEQRVGVRATLADEVVPVDPGATGSTTLTVHNTGTQVEGFTMALSGPAAAWSTAEPAEVSVYPEQAATVTLRFAPPRAPSCPAGRAWYVVRLDSTVHRGLSVTANGAVSVGAYHDVAAELVPASSSGRGTTTHQVVLDNRGNVVERARLAATDDEGLFRLELGRTAVELPPGRVGVPLSVRAPRRWFGRSRPVPIHAQVALDSGGTPVRVDGVRHVVPVFPSWAPVAAVLAALLLCGGAVAAVLTNGGSTDNGGGGAQSTTTGPATPVETTEQSQAGEPTVEVVVSAVNGSYTGPCPPPDDATTYQAVFSVSSGPVTVRFRWTSSNGGDSDPSEQSIEFSGSGAQQRTVTHYERFYLPGRTTNDWIAVNLISPTSGQSNRVPYQLTCA